MSSYFSVGVNNDYTVRESNDLCDQSEHKNELDINAERFALTDARIRKT